MGQEKALEGEVRRKGTKDPGSGEMGDLSPFLYIQQLATTFFPALASSVSFFIAFLPSSTMFMLPNLKSLSYNLTICPALPILGFSSFHCHPSPMHAAISFLYTLTPCFLASWLLPHNYFLTESKSSSSVLNIFNCATQHSSCPSIFLPPLLHGSIVTSFQFLDCCSCASMLLPSLS